jgi:hypothetical protein
MYIYVALYISAFVRCGNIQGFDGRNILHYEHYKAMITSTIQAV